MNVTLKFLRGLLAAVAVFIIFASRDMSDVATPAEHFTPRVMTFLVFFSVAFLHWLLVRYVTATDVFPTADRSQLLAAGESGSQRGFFAGITSVGYLLVFLYSVSLTGFRFPPAETTPFGYFFIGVVFLFLGLLARARGVVTFLIRSQRESLRPSA